MSTFADLLSLVERRYSCRAFTDRAVAREDIDRMLDLAAKAPSDCNSQPWHLSLVSGPALEALRAEMFDAAVGNAPKSTEVRAITDYYGDYQARRRACGWALYDAVGVQKGDRVASAKQAMENFRFFGAPNYAILSSPRALGERGIFDTGIFLAHLLFAARSLGIDTVPQGAVAHYSQIIRKHVPLRDDLQIICGLALGYGDASHPANSFRTERAARDEICQFVE